MRETAPATRDCQGGATVPAARHVRPLARVEAPPAGEPGIGPRPTEVEFLPDWYPRLLRRRRRLAAQLALTIALALGLSFGLASARRRLSDERAELDRLVALRERHRQQDAALAKLGRHVEPSRLLAAVDRAMPPAVSLTELSLETDLGPADLFSLAYLGAFRPPPGEGSRRVRVQLRGVAPTPVEAANFVASLSKLPFLRDVAMTDARERPAEPTGPGAGARLVNEFRITFRLDLAAAGTPPSGG